MRCVSLRQTRRNDHTMGKIVTIYWKFVQGYLMGYLSARRRRAWQPTERGTGATYRREEASQAQRYRDGDISGMRAGEREARHSYGDVPAP
jgi:hypothetical protein